MKIYVAARFEKKEEVRVLYGRLKVFGHTITADWTLHIPIAPYDQNQEMARNYAREDLLGSTDCDIFILLSDENGGMGVHTEFGAALLSYQKFGKPLIYVVGQYNTRNIFYFHPGVNRRETIEQVISEIDGK